MSDRPVADPAGPRAPAARVPGPDLRYVVAGVTAVAEERLTALARAAAGVTVAVGAPAVAVGLALTPAPVRGWAGRLVGRLDERGRAAAGAVAEQGTRLATDLAARAVREPAVMRIVDDVVGRVQWQVVDAVLPVVLDRLAAEPDQVRRIVQDQSVGIAQELADTARARAVSGDEAVDRLFARLLRRRPPRPRAAGYPVPAPVAAPAPALAPAPAGER